MNDDVEVWTRPVRCDGINEVLNIFLASGCSESAPEGAEMGLDYEGTPALALTSETTSTREELGQVETRNESGRFYLDERSLVPVAWVLESRTEVGQLESTVRFEVDNEYVGAGDLPDDFFEPTSIGYVAPTPTNTNPAAELDAPDLGVTVYWLGRAFAPGGTLPPMRLVQSGRGGEGPGYRVVLTYRPEGSDADVAVWLWEPDAWQEYRDAVIPRTSFAASCARQEETALEAGSSLIYLSHEPEQPPAPARPVPVTPPPPGATLAPYATVTPAPSARPAGQGTGECPDRPFDLFMAVVDFEGTIVTVNMPHCVICTGRDFESDPYDSREGMAATLHGLRERAQGE